ncbi:helix-turn-helix domain-containing protein [Desulforamulus ruminis]
MNVSKTASILGYSNMSNFATAFRKKFGCNPSEYLNSIKTMDY